MRKQAPTSLVDSPTLRSNSSAFSIIRMRSDGSLRLSKKAVEARAIAPPITATSYEHAMKKQDSALLLNNQGDSKVRLLDITLEDLKQIPKPALALFSVHCAGNALFEVPLHQRFGELFIENACWFKTVRLEAAVAA